MAHPFQERDVVCRPENLPRLPGEIVIGVWLSESQTRHWIWCADESVHRGFDTCGWRTIHDLARWVRRQNSRFIATLPLPV